MRSRFTFGIVSLVCTATLVAACGGSTAVTELTGPDTVRCQTAVSAPPSAIPAAGNRVTLTVIAARECTWTASSETSWASVSPSSGQGEAPITVNVSANPAGNARTAVIFVNDNRLSLAQEAAPCRYDVSPSSVRLSHDGGRATFQVTATEACAWQAASNQPWARVLTATGTASATVQIEVSRNEGRTPRTATITVAERSVTVEQDSEPGPTPAPEPPGPTPGPGPAPNPNPNPNPNPSPGSCLVSIDSSERTFAQSGGEGSFRVTVPNGCRWSASSLASWVDIQGSSNGSGSETVRYRVAANPTTSSRSGAIVVAGQTHTIRQDGAQPPPPNNGNNDQRVDFSGRVFFVDGSCPNLTFVVEFRRVFTNGDTNFRDACRDIRNGTRVSIDGRLQADGRVRATRVVIDDDDDEDD